MEERNNRLLNAKLNKYIVPGDYDVSGASAGKYRRYDICK